MIEVNWKEFKKGDFLCPHCGSERLNLTDKNASGKRGFLCRNCKKRTLVSCDLSSRPKPSLDGFLCPNCNSGQIMYAGTDYHQRLNFKCKCCRKGIQSSCELTSSPKPTLDGFVCPNCSSTSIVSHGKCDGLLYFRCKDCQKTTPQLCKITSRPRALIEGFSCPNCKSKCVVYGGRNRYGKQGFLCQKCKKKTLESCELSSRPKLSLDGFTCPHCDSKSIGYAGKDQASEKFRFACLVCKKQLLDSCEISAKPKPSLKGFICPHCNSQNMNYAGKSSGDKLLFKCEACNKQTQESCEISAKPKPSLEGFICPHCNSQKIGYAGNDRDGKNRFRCYTCRKNIRSSCALPLSLPSLQGFICPRCNSTDIRHAGHTKKRKKFRCAECQQSIMASCYLYRAPKPSLEGFICPHCGSDHMMFGGTKQRKSQYAPKTMFACGHCGKSTSASCELSAQRNDTKPKLEGFVCPSCESTRMVHSGMNEGVPRFACSDCKRTVLAYWNLSRGPKAKADKASQYQPQPAKPFCYEDDIWDARSFLASLDALDVRRGMTLNFSGIEPNWLKALLKQYITYEGNAGKKIATLRHVVGRFREFGQYLSSAAHCVSIREVTRPLILGFLASYSKGKSKDTVASMLSTLKRFFYIGTLLKWFEVDNYIICSEDYPNYAQGKANDIPWIVMKQIEDKLHYLPEPIARMWIVFCFSAMRLSEISLLKRNCLIHEGGEWAISFWRKKSLDYHSLPITRTMAGVIQEQQDYIQTHFGNEFEYLFCDFVGRSYKQLEQPHLTPAKRLVKGDMLSDIINLLIKEFDIKDENGKQWHFTNRQLRDTRLTDLFEQGHEFAVVQAWAGHKLSMTTQKYVNVTTELMRKETAHIQAMLLNIDGRPIQYEGLPVTFRTNPVAHELDFPEDHINTPIYGFCGLPLGPDCVKGRACYTCRHFIATLDKVPLYIQQRAKLRQKQLNAQKQGQSVMVDIYKQQADTLDKILAGFGEES